MEYFNNILCVEGGWLYQEGEVMSKDNYQKLQGRGWLKVIRRGCNNTPALVEYDSIPERFKKVIISKVGDPYVNVKRSQFKDKIQPDPIAMEFYSTFKLPDGRNLPSEAILEYRINAEILNALHIIINNSKAKRKALGGSTTGIWEKMAEVVEQLKGDFNHTLPSNVRRLKDKYTDYMRDGYHSLVHKGYCNDNSRKVFEQLERLMLSLYVMPNKPFSSSVHDMYLQFLGGNIDVIDCETGEIFDRNDFFDKNGVPIVLSESTVWNYINDPKNRVIVDKQRTGGLEFSSTHRPHHHRHNPFFAFSKVSMDDRDLPRKMLDGNRVKAYYAYDVASGCVIGASFSKLKDKALFIDCMRDMFRFIDKNGFGVPMEMEVEHHLVNKFKDDLMKAGIVFPFVRWCNPGNSQEKHAEHLNRAKKYGYEKKYQDGIGRFYAKLEANRPKTEKIFNETNNEYKEKHYTYERLVADDRAIIELYNNDLHANQKLYKGLTRMQVLIQHANPDMANVEKSLLARYIGETTQTSIRRSQYVTVRYEKYQLPSPEVLKNLEPNNYTVDAFWLPSEDGIIPEVYIYQGDEFLSKCLRIATYNTSTAEQTEDDREAYRDQAKYVAEFDKMTKEGKNKLAKVKIIENRKPFNEEALVIADHFPGVGIMVTDHVVDVNDMMDSEEYYLARSIDSL